MRSSNHWKIYNKTYKCKVNKKNISRNNRRWSYRHEKPLENLEDINEIIRNHRKQLSISKGYWKIMPKDSCEVYKERKRRQVESERSRNVNERSSVNEEQDNNVANKKRKEKKRIGKKRRETDKRFKKNKKKARSCKRRHRCSSCTSSSCSASISSSCTSLSEMDYE